MKKALIITYYWPPSGGPGVQRWLKFIKYLPQQGFEPTVLTVDDRQAYYPLRDEKLASEIPPDVRVIRTPTFEPFGLYGQITGKRHLPKPGFAGEEKPGLIQSIIRFIRGNFFIPDPRKGWNRHLIKTALQLCRQESFAVIITSSPPHSTQLAGLKLKRLTGLPWIADLRDPWTDIYYYQEFRHLPFVKKRDKQMERRVLEQADAVIVVSRSIKNLFLSKSPRITPEKIHIIPNGFDPSDFTPQPRPDSGRMMITYTGTMAANYNTDGFVEALETLVRNNPDIRLHINFIGKISPAITRKMEQHALDGYFEFTDYLPHHEVLHHTRAANILLLVVPDVAHNEGILTGKLFEYLATGSTILGIGPPAGDAGDIIRETNQGTMFHYSDVGGMTAFLTDCYRRWETGDMLRRDNSRAQAYSRPQLTKTLATLMHRLAEQPHPDRP